MTLTAKEFSVPPEIFKSARTTAIQHQGPFTLHFNLPGHNVPGAIDHGYGPLNAPYRRPQACRIPARHGETDPRDGG